MKNILQWLPKSAVLVLLIASMPACNKLTDLTEESPGSYTDKNFPSAENIDTYRFIAYRPISHLRTFITNQQTWMMLEACTDECLVPTRGGGWGDGNRWRDAALHEWTKNHATLNDVWNYLYRGVNLSNAAVKALQGAPDFSDKKALLAQARTIRAFYYYWLMELYGNVPIITATSLEELGGSLPSNSSRVEVFNFIDKEVTEVLGDLPTAADGTTYGLPTRWMGLSMLAKLHLNAEVYGGRPSYDKAIQYCDEIINSKKFDYSEFLTIFAPTNGPNVRETIFAMVNEGVTGFSTMNFIIRFLPAGSDKVFNLKYGTWGGHCTYPEFYGLFNDPNDKRNKMWMVGQQKLPDGTDYVLNGKPFVVREKLDFNTNPSNPFDIGGDDLQGVRSLKYAPDPNGTGNLMGNDYIFFRYSDIVLMKAEAEARKANNPALALAGFNEVRSKRGATPFTSITFDQMLQERGREFAFEHWRRNDLIRFGKFNSRWGIKTNAEAHRIIYPIPQAQLDVNPALKQNPGY